MFQFTNYFWLTGIRRSGNHALQTWLLGPFGRRVIKLNYTVRIAGEKLAQLEAEYDGPDMALIQGAEQLDDIRFEMPPMVAAGNVKQLVILRNPLNNAASQAALWGIDGLRRPAADQFLQLWRRYALEFTGRVSRLPDRVPVNYDEWFASRAYRRELAGRLEIVYSDATLNDVDPDWGKSSFNAMQYAGRAQQMRVLDRWREFNGTPQLAEYVRVLRDHEAFPLFEEIYGGLPKELA